MNPPRSLGGPEAHRGPRAGRFILAIAAGLALAATGAQVFAQTTGTAPAGWIPRHNVVTHGDIARARNAARPPVASSVPTWSTNVVSPLDGQTYNYSMVGASPFAASKQNTVVTVVPIILKVHIGATVFDPTKPEVCETGATTIEDRFLNSPLFFPATFTSNGVNVSAGVVGGTQLGSAFQRANFWQAVQGTGYGVTLTKTAAVVVDLTAPAGSSLSSTLIINCAGGGKSVKYGLIDQGAFDAAIQPIIAANASVTQLPVFLTYQVVLTSGGCCILGYHGATTVAAGIQTYGVGVYEDPNFFTGNADMSTWSHEMAEWLDDPFGDSPTPAWGHLGQVSACQTNLEVGDPLSGSEWSLMGGGGFIYHFQDLVFHDWFYRTPSTSTGHHYSFRSRLSSVQGVC